MSTITQIDENAGGEGVSGTHLPQTRIRVIMKTSPDLLNISNEALFAMTKAAVSARDVFCDRCSLDCVVRNCSSSRS